MSEAPQSDVEVAVADAHRRGWALVLAATARVARDLDLSEECVQEAYAAALATWTRDGIPNSPTGWITTAARRRAIDVLRREHGFRSKLPLLFEPDETVDEVGREASSESESLELRDSVPDERLRLIFLCCHPALAREAQLALTLRLVWGLPTRDLARVFLVSETTMAARLTRAKKKISTARIPYRVPRPHQLPDRVHGVLGVIHLLFTTGHTAPSGTSLMRVELMDQALHLARMLRELSPTSGKCGVCWPCSSSPMLGAALASTLTAGCYGSRTRTAHSGARRPSPRLTLSSWTAARRTARALSAAGRDCLAVRRGADLRAD